jgi:hypothetical protein
MNITVDDKIDSIKEDIDRLITAYLSNDHEHIPLFLNDVLEMATDLITNHKDELMSDEFKQLNTTIVILNEYKQIMEAKT